MKKINFNGKRIYFSLIILFLVSVYFSLDVFADTHNKCRDYDEYCSALPNGGQTTAYTRGEYCYYKAEVGGDDNKACVDRFSHDPNRKCWTTVEKRCSANKKCTSTGCEAVATKPADNQYVTSTVQNVLGDTIKSCGDFGGWCTGNSAGLVLPFMDTARAQCVYPVRETRGDQSCMNIVSNQRCWVENRVSCNPSISSCTTDGCKAVAVSGETTKKRETETLPEKPSEIKIEKKPITVQEVPAINNKEFKLI